MLIDDVKDQMKQAMRNKDTARRDTLRVALGDLQTAASRETEPLSDAKAQQIIRKMIKSNDETIAALASDPDHAERTQALTRENEVLSELMPQTLTPDQIQDRLAPVADDIRAANNDGQATGVAMKHLKTQPDPVEGKDVSAAVRAIRSA